MSFVKGENAMYLKKITLEDFRKFRTQNNEVCFVAARDYVEDEKINIAPKTTLIIGKNNSGKTTIIEALKKLIFGTGFRATDFNLDYLRELLEMYTIEYLEESGLKVVPILKFILTIVIDNSEKDLLTNIIPFMSVGDVKDSEVQIIIQWAPKNEELFFKIAGHQLTVVEVDAVYTKPFKTDTIVIAPAIPAIKPK